MMRLCSIASMFVLSKSVMSLFFIQAFVFTKVTMGRGPDIRL